ncbi:glycosyltransferase [Thetidibacter halocola]|uniref:Glycosyltransferase n=1 Tax=Thetidibacter halocola TaxID=2827239 RepID=A0A8J7WDF5_9RHOB|nr:glycosyltransferase [Thetidibacter halocola]MBS0124409.1 glycosyltransferase [Thetidibacter halocola]
MKSCIATGDYFRLGETFVNRHIDKLFGGETCIVAGRWNGENPSGRPIFVRRQRGSSVADLLVAPYWLTMNTLRHGTSRHPFGSARRDLVSFLRQNGVEVILAEFGTQALALAPLANEMDIPIFTYFRGTDASKSIQSPRIVQAYRKMMPRLAGVFSVSQFLLDNLARVGVTHPNAHVIPSGVNVRTVRPGDKVALKCLAVGRFVEKKAPEITLRAFAEAARDVAEASLTMIGDGPLLERCRALAGELGVADKVVLPGAMPHAAVLAELAGTQVFLQHSITAKDGNTEGLPTAIQEALACGCAVVSTRHAGIPEAVDEGETGWLVDEFDTEGYTRHIAEALRLPAGRLAEMGLMARQVAEARFDNDALLHKLETRILEAMGRS